MLIAHQRQILSGPVIGLPDHHRQAIADCRHP
jgi:hypothetical protein